MPIDYSSLAKAPRLLLEIALQPVQGERFQTTGFSDLGPARYTLPNGTEKLLVESAQSVANRLEIAIWDENDSQLITELAGLSYILVKTSDGKILTNSVLEAHRINSEYIAESMSGDDLFLKLLQNELEYKNDAPVNFKKLHKTLFKYDVNSLVHGTFMEEIGGRLRVTRALSGFIEASDVIAVESGGVKNSRVNPGLKEGRGNVPFPRTEFVAKSLICYFNLDLSLLRGYGLGQEATDLLITLSLLKIQRFLRLGLRLRTACDLEIVGEMSVKWHNTVTFDLPDEAALLAECSRLIESCNRSKLFAEPAITEIVWNPKLQKSKDKKKADEETAD